MIRIIINDNNNHHKNHHKNNHKNINNNNRHHHLCAMERSSSCFAWMASTMLPSPQNQN